LRQFYLLLAEWYAQQKLEDARCYRLICCWVRDVPAFETVFPLWEESEAEVREDDEDGDSSFYAVTAALTPYRNVN